MVVFIVHILMENLLKAWKLRLTKTVFIENLGNSHTQSFWHSPIPFFRVSDAYYFWLLKYQLAFIKLKKSLSGCLLLVRYEYLGTVLVRRTLLWGYQSHTHSIPRILVLPQYLERQAPVSFNNYRFKLCSVHGPSQPIVISRFLLVRF